MTDYISREAAVTAVDESPCWRNSDDWYDHASVIEKNLRAIPAADVRPVVLCRDCIFRSNEWTGCPKLNGTITGDEFFCKCGIKREES